MALELTGEALAVATQHVDAGERDGRRWDAFESVTITTFDQGRVTEVRVGNDFSSADLAAVRKACDERQPVRLAVFLSRGRIYATQLLAVGDTARKAA